MAKDKTRDIQPLTRSQALYSQSHNKIIPGLSQPKSLNMASVLEGRSGTLSEHVAREKEVWTLFPILLWSWKSLYKTAQLCYSRANSSFLRHEINMICQLGTGYFQKYFLNINNTMKGSCCSSHFQDEEIKMQEDKELGQDNVLSSIVRTPVPSFPIPLASSYPCLFHSQETLSVKRMSLLSVSPNSGVFQFPVTITESLMACLVFLHS